MGAAASDVKITGTTYTAESTVRGAGTTVLTAASTFIYVGGTASTTVSRTEH